MLNSILLIIKHLYCLGIHFYFVQYNVYRCDNTYYFIWFCAPICIADTWTWPLYTNRLDNLIHNIWLCLIYVYKIVVGYIMVNRCFNYFNWNTAALCTQAHCNVRQCIQLKILIRLKFKYRKNWLLFYRLGIWPYTDKIVECALI